MVNFEGCCHQLPLGSDCCESMLPLEDVRFITERAVSRVTLSSICKTLDSYIPPFLHMIFCICMLVRILFGIQHPA